MRFWARSAARRPTSLTVPRDGVQLRSRRPKMSRGRIVRSRLMTFSLAGLPRRPVLRGSLLGCDNCRSALVARITTRSPSTTMADAQTATSCLTPGRRPVAAAAEGGGRAFDPYQQARKRHLATSRTGCRNGPWTHRGLSHHPCVLRCPWDRCCPARCPGVLSRLLPFGVL
jgi:hypothetical protein